MSNSDSPIIVALDFPDRATALNLVEQLDPSRCRLKVGKEMFTRLGPDFVEGLAGKGFDGAHPSTVSAAKNVARAGTFWLVGGLTWAALNRNP